MGKKGVDENNYFNLNEYFFMDFTPEVYLSRDLTEESKVTADTDGKYGVTVDDTVYISLSDVLPESAM